MATFGTFAIIITVHYLCIAISMSVYCTEYCTEYRLCCIVDGANALLKEQENNIALHSVQVLVLASTIYSVAKTIQGFS